MSEYHLQRLKKASFNGTRRAFQAQGFRWDLTFEDYKAIMGIHWGMRRHDRIRMELIDPSLGFVVDNVYIRNRYGLILEPTKMNQEFDSRFERPTRCVW